MNPEGCGRAPEIPQWVGGGGGGGWGSYDSAGKRPKVRLNIRIWAVKGQV